MIKAILFDFGGVIYKHQGTIVPHVLAIIFNTNQEKINEEYQKYKNTLVAGKISTESLLLTLKKKFSTDKTIEELEKQWLSVYGELTKPDEGVLDLIRILKRKYKIYLFTNTNEMNDRYNKNTGIYNYFDEIFCSFKMGMAKPDLGVYQFVLAEITTNPEETVFIDNQEENLLPAKTLGMKTILFDVLKDELEKLKRELRNLGVI